MIEELIKDYKTHLTVNGLLKNEYKIWYYIVYVLFILSMIITLGAFLLVSFFHDYLNITLSSITYYVLIIVFFLMFMFTLPTFLYIKDKMIYRLFKRDYKEFIDENSYGFLNWSKIDSAKLSLYFLDKLNDYLEEKGLTPDKYDELINMLQDKLKKAKEPFLFQSGVISALTLIAFSAFCNSFYKLGESIPNSFILITVTIIMVIWCMVAAATMHKKLYEFQYSTISDLITLLKEHRLRRKTKPTPQKEQDDLLLD